MTYTITITPDDEESTIQASGATILRATINLLTIVEDTVGDEFDALHDLLGLLMESIVILEDQDIAEVKYHDMIPNYNFKLTCERT